MMLGWEGCEVGCGKDLSLRRVGLTWGFDEREKPRDAQRLKWSLGQKEPIVGDCGNMTAQRLSIYSVVITAHVCLSYHRKGFLFFLSLRPLQQLVQTFFFPSQASGSLTLVSSDLPLPYPFSEA